MDTHTMTVRERRTPTEHAGAVYSPCRRHRVALWRIWKTPPQWIYGQPCPTPLLVFVGLNPSTATETKLDPTVTRCHRRALALGYGGMVMLNLFSLRSTDPQGLYARRPNHKGNDAEMVRWLGEPEVTAVAAWGAFPLVGDRERELKERLRAARVVVRWKCLGLTRQGAPRHPLYVAYRQPLRDYPG